MKKTMLGVLAALALGSSALADGFSITGNLQFLPSFGLVGGQFITPYRSYRGTAINYTANLSDNVLVGASLRPGYFGGVFALASRVGGVAVIKLNESDNGYVEAAFRLGSNQVILPSPFSFNFDAGAEIFLTQRVASAVVLYATLEVSPSVNLVPSINGFTGLKLELTRDLEAYLEGGLRYTFGGLNNLNYDLTSSLYYEIQRGLRLGLYTGLQGVSGGTSGFKLGIAGEWTEKPETLGTPGNYLP
jgi:hypothetical protein